MGKKKGKVKITREDDDIDLTVPSCRHIKKGTDQTLLKKFLSNSRSCQDCKQEKNKNSSQAEDSVEEKDSEMVWICLKCGHRGCGRNSENKHAIKHYKTPRSDSHCLVVSLDTWSVWCYECDDEVQYSTTGHLAQLVTNLKKLTSADPIKTPPEKVKEEMDVSDSLQTSESVQTTENDNKKDTKSESPQRKNVQKDNATKSLMKSKTDESCGVPVKGLSNLGNTCFFNAVIQNLSQTQLLRETLTKVTEKTFTLDIKPDVSLELEPLVMELDQPGFLTLAMCQLLNEILETKKSVVTPKELFAQVCKKAARFKGFQQQDSQELLRYLLDGMRNEELKRVNAGITEALKQSGKFTEEEQLKTQAKEYEKKGLVKNFVDQVFGGEMTSTIMCQQCKTVSVVLEVFLDLSLPVFEEAYRKKNPKTGYLKNSESNQEGKKSPALNTENDEIPTGASSKYQQKKAKKQAKKQAKHQKRQQKFEDKVSLDSLTSQSGTETGQAVASGDTKLENTDDEEHEKTSLSDETPTPVSVSEQDQSTELEEEDSTSVSNHFTVLSGEQQDSLEEGEDTELVEKMGKINLDNAFIEDSVTMEDGMERGDEILEAKEYTVINQDPELAFKTLAPRVTPEKQECSVQSSLFHFTEVETLTQSNSLLCITCTKEQHNERKNGGSKTNVYTEALKQILISRPPAVLTLHLKRFQQNGYSFCKVNRHVHFPLILDLAPFCAVKCKDVLEEDTQILYSLYGIVEHSGTMRSGHYTAYVKVRPEHPKASIKGLSLEEADLPRGSWFHISDTSVQPVSESKVMNCQAYLLFYERLS